MEPQEGHRALSWDFETNLIDICLVLEIRVYLQGELWKENKIHFCALII